MKTKYHREWYDDISSTQLHPSNRVHRIYIFMEYRVFHPCEGISSGLAEHNSKKRRCQWNTQHIWNSIKRVAFDQQRKSHSKNSNNESLRASNPPYWTDESRRGWHRQKTAFSMGIWPICACEDVRVALRSLHINRSGYDLLNFCNANCLNYFVFAFICPYLFITCPDFLSHPQTSTKWTFVESYLWILASLSLTNSSLRNLSWTTPSSTNSNSRQPV